MEVVGSIGKCRYLGREEHVQNSRVSDLDPETNCVQTSSRQYRRGAAFWDVYGGGGHGTIANELFASYAYDVCSPLLVHLYLW